MSRSDTQVDSLPGPLVWLLGMRPRTLTMAVVPVVVGGVKSILFGDEADYVQVAGPPPGSVEQAYRSPLEN